MSETPNEYTLGDMGMSPQEALYSDQIHDVVAAAWDEIERTGELRQEGRADVRLAMVHATTACRPEWARAFTPQIAGWLRVCSA